MYISTGVKGLGQRLQKLGYSSYEEYLSSEHWIAFKKRVYAWAYKLYGKPLCEICKRNNCVLNIHHRSYKRLGKERIGDIILICEDCHLKIHKLSYSTKYSKKNLWRVTKLVSKQIRNEHSG